MFWHILGRLTNRSNSKDMQQSRPVMRAGAIAEYTLVNSQDSTIKPFCWIITLPTHDSRLLI